MQQADTTQQQHPDDALIAALALAALLALLLRRRVTAGTPALARAVLGSLTPRLRAIWRDRLQTSFSADAATLARTLATTHHVGAWHGALNRQLSTHLYQQRALGSAGRLIVPDAATIAVLTVQRSYLQRFAATVSGASTQGTPLSVEAVASRSAQYSGAGRAAFFSAAESDSVPGLVAHYLAIDAAGTCAPCLAAEGYYLPQEGPMPGDVCLGHGYCRCVRVLEHNPAEYARLRGP